MSIGLLMNLLGGGGQAQTTAPAANNNLNASNLISAFNNAYQAGMTAGLTQSGMGYATGNGNASANANAAVNIGLYGGGYMVPSLVSNVYGDMGGNQGGYGRGSHAHGDYGDNVFQRGHAYCGTQQQGQGNYGVQASRPMGAVNVQPGYGVNTFQGSASNGGSMPAVLPGLSADQTSQLLAGLGMSPTASASAASQSQGGGGPLSGLGGMVSGILGGILGKDGVLGPLGGIVGIPLGLFSGLVGHDSAGKAAANGDVMGWLVNTLDHTGHSHAMGGAAGGGSSAPLAIVGTLGQELGGMVGLDKLFGSAQAYDKQYGTNYAAGGSPNYGSGGLGGLLGGGGGAGHSAHGGSTQSAGNGGLLGGLLNII